MPKISVVVPVYNVEKYLEQCLESIIHQTLEDIEIILVDDGSTDKSGEICDYYATQDKRIRVIHKPNEGLSCARNDGIDNSTANFIMFVDSDDWVEPDFCSCPYKEAVENDSDLVLFIHKRVDGNKTSVARTKLKSGILSTEDALYYNTAVTNGCWIGLYRKSLFEKVRFPEGKYYEDVGATHRLIFFAKKKCLIQKCLYNRRICRYGSITTDPLTRDHPDLREMFTRKINDFQSWGFNNLAQLLAFSLLIIYGWKRSDQKYFVSVVNGIENPIPDIFSLKMKIMLGVYRVSPVVFDLICIMTGKRTKK